MDNFAMMIFAAVLVIVGSSYMMYRALSDRISDMKDERPNALPVPQIIQVPYPVYPQGYMPAAPEASAPVAVPAAEAVQFESSGGPMIRVNGGEPVSAEIMAVLAAAVKAYEADTALEASQAVEAPIPVLDVARPSADTDTKGPDMVSPAAELEDLRTVKTASKRTGSLWVATARHESHQRL